MSTPLYGIFRENVEHLLAAKKLNQSQLADRMGVTQSYVSQILTGYRNVGLEAVDKFATALGVAPDSLLKTPRRPRAHSA